MLRVCFYVYYLFMVYDSLKWVTCHMMLQVPPHLAQPWKTSFSASTRRWDQSVSSSSPFSLSSSCAQFVVFHKSLLANVTWCQYQITHPLLQGLLPTLCKKSRSSSIQFWNQIKIFHFVINFISGFPPKYIDYSDNRTNEWPLIN